MKPFRLFIILVFLTACALAIVSYRVASVQTAHRVQKEHARLKELMDQYHRNEAEIARLIDEQVRRAKQGGPAGSPVATPPPRPPNTVDVGDGIP